MCGRCTRRDAGTSSQLETVSGSNTRTSWVKNRTISSPPLQTETDFTITTTWTLTELSLLCLSNTGSTHFKRRKTNRQVFICLFYADLFIWFWLTLSLYTKACSDHSMNLCQDVGFTSHQPKPRDTCCCYWSLDETWSAFYLLQTTSCSKVPYEKLCN